MMILKSYSAVKIMTQAVSRQKKEILYLSPQANTCKCLKKLQVVLNILNIFDI